MSKPGIFITFEGPEGCGKTTHSRLLYAFLNKIGFKVVYTREPGGTKVGEKIRHILLDPKNRDIGTLAEVLLYTAARVEVLRQIIRPSLEEGKIVICDRFYDATLAYQGYGGGLDISLIKKIQHFVIEGLRPDITFLLDIDVKEGLYRSGRKRDRIELRSLAYHNKVRRGYLSIARDEPARVKVVSAVGEIEETQGIIRELVLKICHLKT